MYYSPPASGYQCFNTLEDILVPDKSIILAGDFNLPGLLMPNAKINALNTVECHECLNLVNILGFRQYVTKPTCE